MILGKGGGVNWTVLSSAEPGNHFKISSHQKLSNRQALQQHNVLSGEGISGKEGGGDINTNFTFEKLVQPSKLFTNFFKYCKVYASKVV